MISPDAEATLLFAVFCVSAVTLFLLWLYENTIGIIRNVNSRNMSDVAIVASTTQAVSTDK